MRMLCVEISGDLAPESVGRSHERSGTEEGHRLRGRGFEAGDLFAGTP